jgi:hypothetical protein
MHIDVDNFKKALEESPSANTPLEVRKKHEKVIEELMQLLDPIDLLILYKLSYINGTRIVNVDSELRKLIGKEVRRISQNVT